MTSKYLTPEECHSIHKVVEHFYEDELKHYESFEVPPKDHIFLDIKNLISVLNKLHTKSNDN
jgi:hypothetical protein